MTVAVPAPEAGESLAALAREAAENFPDVEQAIAHVRHRLDREPELREALLDMMIERAIRGAIHDVRECDRRTLVRQNPSARTLDNVAAFEERLLDTWTVGNKRLGDVLGSELDPVIAEHTAAARGHMHRRNFYRALRARVGDHVRVRDALSEEQVRQISKQTKAAA